LLSFGADLVSSSLLSKNIKIKIYRTILLPVVLYGCKTWSLTSWEERRLTVLKRVFGPSGGGNRGVEKTT